MPVIYSHNKLNYSKYAMLKTGGKLGVPVFEYAKAIAGIRTHVFEPEEYRI